MSTSNDFVVENCNECPLFHYDDLNGYACRLMPEKESNDFMGHNHMDNAHPECPLRRGPSLITLRTTPSENEQP